MAIIHAGEFQSGYSFDAMRGQTAFLTVKSFHDFEESILAEYTQVGIPVKVVQSFPASPSLRFRLLKHFSQQSIGLAFSHSGTGGRLHYADYSGSASVDYTLSINGYSLVFRTKNLGQPKFRIYQATQLGIKTSQLELSETFTVWEESESEKFKVENISYCIEPGIELEMTIWKGISLGIYAGADIIVYSDAFHLPGNKEAKLMFGDREPLKADWVEFQMAIKFIAISF